MDWPLRTRLFVALVGVVLVSAALTVPTGSLLISRMVVREAQERVSLALQTADEMLQVRLAEAQRAAEEARERIIAEGAGSPLSTSDIDDARLDDLRKQRGYDFLRVVDTGGRVLATARGSAAGRLTALTPVLRRALAGEPHAGVSLVPLEALVSEDPDLATRVHVEIQPTPHAKPEGPSELLGALVLEAAVPVLNEAGEVKGAVELGTVVNKNSEFVDLVRASVFTIPTYKGKNFGTVTIFQDDVRVATNVVGPDGRRAIGTRVSAEVNEQVLGRGQLWEGPAVVVDSWYLSAYEPLRDADGRTIGMLYVGVLKDRYDDMRAQAIGSFLGIAAVAVVVAAALSHLVSVRLTRPLAALTVGASEVARGNLDYHLAESRTGEHDEIAQLTTAFDRMVAALRERDEQLRASNAELRRTADELQQWVQNYLDILGFITHELKNQIAAMTINLFAVRDGYVGEITEDQRQALDDVAKTIERSEEMILNYLNLSRIEKGELEVRAQPLDIDTDIVQPVLKDLRGAVDGRGVTVEVDLPPELLIQADPSLLRIAYSNLLSNAVKYGRRGGRIRVYGARTEGRAELHVWNDGPGVPPEKMDQLFRKFTRLDAPIDDQPGTGLGLFITREIVRRHGGDIHAESAHGEWIDFVMTLPVPDALL